MTRSAVGGDEASVVRIAEGPLADFTRTLLARSGYDALCADAAARAVMHGSLLGIDSHGVRLIPHYVRVVEGGRVNGRPRFSFSGSMPAVSVLDADDGHGAAAAQEAMRHAVDRARQVGLAAVAIRRTSHFGPAGAFALQAAQTGMIGLVAGNSDPFVRLHDGAVPFHGTNPLAVAVPSGGSDPWLLDMATSSIPYNRVQLYRGLGRALPAGVASNGSGEDTSDPSLVAMLAPLGGLFGFKGAALAGLAEILSSALADMQPGCDVPSMAGPDFATPRGLSAFVLALNPGAFLPREAFQDRMRTYLAKLRSTPARPGARILAPGDREWEEMRRRLSDGIPVDLETMEAFADLARRYDVPLPDAQDRPKPA